MQGDGKDGPRRPGRLRGIVDAMASPDAGEPSGSGGDGAADAAAPTGRRTRFAPKVPSERRARNPRAVAEETAEPKLSTHVQHLVKQAQLEGKTVRPREPVRGLERRPRRGEADHAKPAAVASIEPPHGGLGRRGARVHQRDGRGRGSPRAAFPGDAHRRGVLRGGLAVEIKVGQTRRMPDSVVTKRKPAAKAERLEATLEATMPASPMDADAPPDWTPDADWTDKTQYYPTVLAPEPREPARRRRRRASRRGCGTRKPPPTSTSSCSCRRVCRSRRTAVGAAKTSRSSREATGTHRRDPPETIRTQRDASRSNAATRDGSISTFPSRRRRATWRKGASVTWRCARTAR